MEMPTVAVTVVVLTVGARASEEKAPIMSCLCGCWCRC